MIALEEPTLNLLRIVYRRTLALAQRSLNALGLNAMRVADYYSPLPVLGRLAERRQRWDRPSELPGVRFDRAGMKSLLGALAADYGEEYRGLVPYEEAKTLGYGPGFTAVDAMVVYWMLRHLKPRRYVEIGSGLSTYYASLALAKNSGEGSPCEMSCIDPYARAEVRTIPGLEVVAREVQDVGPDSFRRLGPGDVLFIDSTHVVKIDGDVPHLYLEVVPRVAEGVVIHSHDIHFPYNVPHPAEQYLFAQKWPSYWTEAMLLQAFLAFNPAYEILLSAPLLRHGDEDFLRRTIRGYRPVEAGDYDTHFGSLWFRRIPVPGS
jgi:predicted O-methyltransferase YrrM